MTRRSTEIQTLGSQDPPLTPTFQTRSEGCPALGLRDGAGHPNPRHPPPTPRTARHDSAAEPTRLLWRRQRSDRAWRRLGLRPLTPAVVLVCTCQVTGRPRRTALCCDPGSIADTPPQTMWASVSLEPAPSRLSSPRLTDSACPTESQGPPLQILLPGLLVPATGHRLSRIITSFLTGPFPHAQSKPSSSPIHPRLPQT